MLHRTQSSRRLSVSPQRRRRSRPLTLEPLEDRTLLSAGPLVINEFMAVNNTGELDEDEDYSDWIEIYNPTNAGVDLEGWYLTDDPDDLDRWQFPRYLMAPGEYLVVYASGKDRHAAGVELHTNFRLDGDGEYLALVRPGEVPPTHDDVAHEFAPAYPEQFGDVSYGMPQEGATFFVPEEAQLTYTVPTPGDAALCTLWTGVGFDDSSWSGFTQASGVLLTEVGTEDPDYVEIQNVSDRPINTTGWVVVANDGTRGDVNKLHSTNWSLPEWIAPGEAIYVSDEPEDTEHYWGELIKWRTVSFGWVMLVDDVGTVADFIAWGYATSQLDELQITVDGREITLADAWAGDPPPPKGSSANSLQRRGGSDHDNATDWAWIEPPSKGRANDGLVVPFSTDVATGIGFDAAQTGLAGSIQIDVQPQMHQQNASLWVRIPFEVGDPTALETVQLRIQYNDGFVAYLNGQEVARRNAPDLTLWNSAATDSREIGESLAYEEIDVSAHLGALREGPNVLAIHGLNATAADENFLILPDLVQSGRQYFDNATPGEENLTGFHHFVKDTSFSVDRGFFDAPFSVEITTTTEGAAIYYTLDGTRPGEGNGTLYTGPIPIETTTMLRAVATKPGYRPTNIDTQTYIFPQDVIHQPPNPVGAPSTWEGSTPADYEMDPDVVNDPLYRDLVADALRTHPTISLVIDPVDLWSKATGIYSNTKDEGRPSERDVSIELIDFPGAENLNVAAGVRIHGSASRNTSRPKHNFRLVFRNEYGLGKLEYPLFGNTEVQRFNDIILRGGNGDSWFHPNSGRRPQAQYTHDQWHKQTQIDMGQPTSQQGDAHVYVNGLYWGFYHVIERPEWSFMEEHFGGDKEDYDVIQHKGGTVNGTRDEWNALMNLVRAGGLTNDVKYQDVLHHVDPDNLADFMLLNFYSGNTDWDHNNWYGARNHETDDGWKFFSWDAEVTFRNLSANITNVNKNNQPSEVHQRLSVNAEYKMIFADRVHKHFFNGGALTPGAVEKSWMDRAAEIELPLVAESARWGDHHRASNPYTVEGEFRARQNYFLNTWFPQRTGIVLGQIKAKGMYPSVVAPSFKIGNKPQHGGLMGVGDHLTVEAPSGTIYYTLDGSDPRLYGGAVSETAQVYAAPVTIDDTVLVRSRVLKSGQWSAMNEAQFYVHVPAAAENLAISEIHYNPPEPTAAELATQAEGDPDFTAADFEFIELFNTTTDRAVDLNGLRFSGDPSFTFDTPDVTSLAPQSYVVVVSNPEAFAARYGNELNVAGQYTGHLDNRGEQITLYDHQDELIFNFDYDNGNDWPGRADGKGASLELRDPATTAADEYGNEAVWHSSVHYNGTPGAEPAEPAGVVVSEVLTHTDWPQRDAIELHNTADVPVDVGGWYLSDEWGWDWVSDTGDYKKFRVPDDTVIPGGGYIAFYEGHYVDGVLEQDESEFGGNDPKGFALNGAEGDDVWLMEAGPGDALLRFADHAEFAAAANGESFGLWPDVDGRMVPMHEVTLGSENTGPRVGPVVISEIMYHPPGGDGFADEFVELVNTSGRTVPLFDPDNTQNTWKLTGTGFDFPAGAQMAPGSVALVVPTSPAVFRSRYDVPGDVQIFGPYSGALNNAGERIRLMRPDGPTPEVLPYVLVDEVDYLPAEGWPIEADGSGVSLQRSGGDAWGNDAANWTADVPTPGQVEWSRTTAQVVGRHLFYNGSSFDGNSPAANAADDAAVATDKTALLPGQIATFSNYASYHRGINGLMVDVAGLPAGTSPAADDFRFRVGNSNDPATWPDAPAPTAVTLRAGAGVDGSDRITIVWAEHAIQSQWLEVTLPAANFGLGSDDVFYFGSAIAEGGNSPANAQVTTTDLLLARNNPRNFLNPAAIDFAFDYNRDQRVNSTDLLLARNNQTNFLTALRLIDLSSAAGQAQASEEASPASDAVDLLLADL